MEASSLTTLQKELEKCNRCGTCRAYCPVFLQTDREWYGARGRMALLEAAAQGKIELSDFYKDVIYSCLYCHTCVDNCPSLVPVDNFILSSREQFVKEKGLPLLQKIGFNLLKDKKLLDSGMKTLALLDRYSPQFLKRVFISLLSRNGHRTLPQLAEKPLSLQVPERISVKNPKLRIAFFTGCLIEYLYPQIGISLLNLLKGQGIEVIIPREQHCCGIPLLTSGEKRGAEYLARQNVELFSRLKVDYIVNACASCGSTLKEYGKHFENLKVEKENWKAKIMDITEFLVKFTDLKFRPVLEGVLTYHDPCHLRRRQGVFKEPREILRTLSPVDFVEMEEANSCCGGGGLFSVKYYDVSRKIAQEKIGHAEATKASLIVTACPGCILHLNDSLHQNKSEQKAVHLVELLK